MDSIIVERMITPNIPLKPYSNQDDMHMSDVILRICIVLIVLVLLGIIGGIVVMQSESKNVDIM